MLLLEFFGASDLRTYPPRQQGRVIITFAQRALSSSACRRDKLAFTRTDARDAPACRDDLLARFPNRALAPRPAHVRAKPRLCKSALSPPPLAMSDHDSDRYSDSDESSSSFEHLEICPLEAQCNPELNGTFDKQAVLARVAKLSAAELASLAELCMCPKGCKYRKCVDSDVAWWPHCADAWYEPGAAPEKMGKPPKQRKTWKNAYLALRPEEGPTPEEIAAREAKIKAREEKMAQWELENKAGKMSIKGAGRGGETIVSPVNGKEDKGAMREFYKTVRSKPKGKTRKGADATHADGD